MDESLAYPIQVPAPWTPLTTAAVGLHIFASGVSGVFAAIEYGPIVGAFLAAVATGAVSLAFRMADNYAARLRRERKELRDRLANSDERIARLERKLAEHDITDSDVSRPK